MTWNHDISSAPRGETGREDLLVRIAMEIDADWVQGLFGTTNDNGAQVISKAISMYLDATNSVIVSREQWQPIETAPKDGTLIRVGWKFPEDAEMQEWFTMQWGHIQKNGLFPGATGMWVVPSGELTWNDDGDHGPTHWMPLPTAASQFNTGE